MKSLAVIGALIGGAVLVLIGLSPLSTYLRAGLVGPDVGSLWRPLVRHEESQKHCYDDGSQFCEQNRGEHIFTKEFTIGYLLHSKSGNQNTQALYGCANRRTGQYGISFTRRECHRRSMNSHLLGYVFTSDTIEASTPLYRCFGQGGEDTLFTDDANECTLLNYQSAEKVGFMPSAGHLPMRRLRDFCAIAKERCPSSGGSQVLREICNQSQNFCKDL